MEIRLEENRVWIPGEFGGIEAEVTFPQAGVGLVEIDHTFVAQSLRGQGIAGILMEKAAQVIRESGKLARPVCSYAVKWFQGHPEYCDILVQED